MTTMVVRGSEDAALQAYRMIFDLYPSVDEHEFATAYVNYVADTGNKPNVWDSIERFASKGVIA